MYIQVINTHELSTLLSMAMNTSDPIGVRPLRPVRILAFCALLVLGGLLLLAVLRPGLLGRTPTFHGTAYEPPEPAPEFTLVDHTGRSVALTDYRGKSVLLFFGFINCPDVCPLTLSRLGRTLESLGRSSDNVAILLVTVDPERDTPQALASYIEHFGSRVSGLTGDPQALEQMRAAYGAYAVHHAGTDGHPQVMHSSAVFGIDRRGLLRVLIRADGPDEEIRSDVRTLLAQ